MENQSLHHTLTHPHSHKQTFRLTPKEKESHGWRWNTHPWRICSHTTYDDIMSREAFNSKFIGRKWKNVPSFRCVCGQNAVRSRHLHVMFAGCKVILSQNISATSYLPSAFAVLSLQRQQHHTNFSTIFSLAITMPAFRGLSSAKYNISFETKPEIISHPQSTFEWEIDFLFYLYCTEESRVLSRTDSHRFHLLHGFSSQTICAQFCPPSEINVNACKHAAEQNQIRTATNSLISQLHQSYSTALCNFLSLQYRQIQSKCTNMDPIDRMASAVRMSVIFHKCVHKSSVCFDVNCARCHRCRSKSARTMPETATEQKMHWFICSIVVSASVSFPFKQLQTVYILHNATLQVVGMFSSVQC